MAEQSYYGWNGPNNRSLAALENNTPIEHIFYYDGLAIAAQEWGDPNGVPVLALHGWLDNCGSFAPLGGLLKGIRLIAIDAPGHGLSSHRSADGTYNIWQDVAVVHDIAEQLGWSTFALLGHSRGAMVCALMAGTFPDRISHLALLDTFVPLVIQTEEQPEQLARSILDRKKRWGRQAKVYPSEAALIETRKRGVTPLSDLSAPYILARGGEAVEGGYRWRSDEKLKIDSEIKLTRELVQSFVERIDCPILLLLSDMERTQRFYGMEAVAKNIRIREIKGGHHFHMEEPAPRVAEALVGFLARS